MTYKLEIVEVFRLRDQLESLKMLENLSSKKLTSKFNGLSLERLESPTGGFRRFQASGVPAARLGRSLENEIAQDTKRGIRV